MGIDKDLKLRNNQKDHFNKIAETVLISEILINLILFIKLLWEYF